MDGDGLCSVEDITRLVEHFPRYDFVNGRRIERMDSRSRRFASRIANGLRSLVLGDGMQDTGGTPKAMKRECVAYLVPFDGMHRFIPAMLRRAGFKLLEIPVSHRERKHGRSKYGNWERGLRGAWDLVGVSWLLRRRFTPGELESSGGDGDSPGVEAKAPSERAAP
jgi:dolichol-phosphate mannosyltransferase